MSVSPLRTITERLEPTEAIDAVAAPVSRTARGVLGNGGLKDVLRGTWIGHALHPLLTDVVVGSFTSATILDLVGGDDDSVQRLGA